jgi:hypothetical protein
MKRLLILSDLHCGNVLGLTSPKYYSTEISRKFWDWYVDEINSLGKVDHVVCNGDAIDGKALATGGKGLFENDRLKQVDIAYDCFTMIDCDNFTVVRGSEYHTGKGEDFEDTLAEKLGEEKSCNEKWLDINGFLFHFRHHTNSSATPWGRFTAVAREKAWKDLESLKYNNNRVPDAVIRSHVHYYTQAYSTMGLTMTTPALQLNSSYGQRRCAGITDIGFVVFDIESKEDYSWKSHILRLDLAEERIQKV